ncbi:MAG: hypothetical protein ACXWV0_03140 [Flavisolibacter sp.]
MSKSYELTAFNPPKGPAPAILAGSLSGTSALLSCLDVNLNNRKAGKPGRIKKK